jgi:hypothetical protein
MFVADKFYPVQGSNRFQTSSFPITKAFRINCAGSTVGTHTCFSVPKGSKILGFSARVAEAVESSGAATVQLGFTGVGSVLSTAHGSGAATLGTIITGNSNSALSSKTAQMIYIPIADETFDFIVGTAPISTGSGAGKIDVFLTYIPLPTEDLSTAEFLSYSF